MIEELSVQFPLQECCVTLNVSRSGYYQWLGAEQSARAQANVDLLKEIRRVYDEHKGRYGSPRVTQQVWLPPGSTPAQAGPAGASPKRKIPGGSGDRVTRFLR